MTDAPFVVIFMQRRQNLPNSESDFNSEIDNRTITTEFPLWYFDCEHPFVPLFKPGSIIIFSTIDRGGVRMVTAHLICRFSKSIDKLATELA